MSGCLFLFFALSQLCTCLCVSLCLRLSLSVFLSVPMFLSLSLSLSLFLSLSLSISLSLALSLFLSLLYLSLYVSMYVSIFYKCMYMKENVMDQSQIFVADVLLPWPSNIHDQSSRNHRFKDIRGYCQITVAWLPPNRG